jgi:hypothetical protein
VFYTGLEELDWPAIPFHPKLYGVAGVIVFRCSIVELPFGGYLGSRLLHGGDV